MVFAHAASVIALGRAVSAAWRGGSFEVVCAVVWNVEAGLGRWLDLRREDEELSRGDADASPCPDNLIATSQPLTSLTSGETWSSDRGDSVGCVDLIGTVSHNVTPMSLNTGGAVV